MEPEDISGSWTYRSFHNNSNPVDGDPEAAVRLIFAEAAFIFQVPSLTTLKGEIDWGSGGLDLEGTIDASSVLTVSIVGMGRPGTQTEGWRYDYFCHDAHAWPSGIDQVPALVGSVIRVNPHGGAQAGYVASFIAVRRP